MGQLKYYLYCKTRCIIGIGQQGNANKKLINFQCTMYICANMNALVLPIVIFTLSYLKCIKVLFVYLGFYIIMDDSI